MARIGANFVGPGSPQPVYQLQASLRERGARIGLVRVTNEHAAVAGLEAETVVFRVFAGPGRNEPSPLDYRGRKWTGQEWFDFFWPSLAPAKREPGREIVYTFLNEVYRPEHAAFFVRFYTELMAAADRAGVTISVGNFSGGVFGTEGDETRRRNEVAALVPLAKEAARRGHYMSGNVYEWSEDPARFEYLVPLQHAVPEAEWIIEELGWADQDASYKGYVALKVLVSRYRATYPNTDAALWCFNGSGGGWSHSQIPVDDAVAALSLG